MFDGLPKRSRGKRGRDHPASAVRARATRWRTCPTRSASGSPTHTLTDSSVDGLGLVVRAVEEAPRWLRPDGWLLIEVEPDRATRRARVMRDGGFREIASTKGGELKVTRVIVGGAADDEPVAPYGTWSSPITAEMLASAASASPRRVAGGRRRRTGSRAARPRADGPWSCGRSAFTSPADVTPAGFNVRTKVHEYGGGAYCVHRGTVFFSELRRTSGSTGRSPAADPVADHAGDRRPRIGTRTAA